MSSKWTPVSEKLPENFRYVLIYQADAGDQHRIAYRMNGEWKWPNILYDHPCKPSHWMEIPRAPE
jgi:hypothetical protein